MLFEMLRALGHQDRAGTVLYHAFFPNTRVMHVLMADKALLANPPAQDVLGLGADEDHPELDGILTSMLMAANDLADEFGEELRAPDSTTQRMRDFFQRAFVKRIGSGRLNGRAFKARAGVGMNGPAAWALHGWSLTT